MELESSAGGSLAIFFRVIGLEVKDSFTLGKARFFTCEDGLARLVEVGKEPLTSSIFAGPDKEFITCNATLIELATDSQDAAISSARRTLDVLRVIYRREVNDTPFLIFGLDGELASGAIRYLVFPDGVSGGVSSVLRGASHITGVTLFKSVLERWRGGKVFRFLDESLRSPDTSDGARRALLGTSLLSTSILERNPDVALVLAMSALEALVMPEGNGGKTFKLARHLAWFGCLVNDERNQCGRHRDACAYLLLNPDKRKELTDLQEIRKIAESKEGWLCGEWMRIVNWYDARSTTVHGGPLGHSEEIADKARYWITTRLYQQIILWLVDHPDDPIGDLEHVLNTLPRPANWTEVATKIRDRDFDTPPQYDSRRWEER